MLVAALAVTPSLGWGAEPLPGGKEMYERYCASCHGVSGKGDGVVAEFMTPKPTDLTKLAASAGGQLSETKLRQVIDGTQTVRAHGDSKMPVWGEVLRADATSPVQETAEPRSKLMLISNYVMSIQQK
jgi:mono/diheme cytochrome c family protein